MNKICKDCKLLKSIEDFHKDAKSKDLHRNMCKKCDNIRREKHKQDNYELTKYHSRKNAAKRRLKFPKKNRSDMLLFKYGITLEQYNEMLRKQDNKCKICNKESYMYDNRIKGFKNLAVDHDHKTGKVRGLLCDSCNHGLGNFRDNIDTLYNAMIYLREAI